MLDHHKTYMLESKRIHVKDIMRNPDLYTCKMMTAEDGSECYLEFYQKETRELSRFSLVEFQPVHRLTTTFIEGSKSIELGDQVDDKCMMYRQEPKMNLKRNRQALEEEPVEDDSDDDLIFNQHIKDKEQFKGNVSHLIDEQKKIRYHILKILEEAPEGNISSSDVRELLKKRHQLQIPESHARKTMEELCEPSSERTNRKYILKSQYKSSDSETIRKKQKTS